MHVDSYAWMFYFIHWPINLDKWEWSKGVIFCSNTWKRKLAFTYSPGLITAWKCLLVMTKVKTIMQYYDKLGTCFRINLSFSNGGQTNQNFLIKTELFEVSDLLHPLFSFRCVPRHARLRHQIARPKYWVLWTKKSYMMTRYCTNIWK